VSRRRQQITGLVLGLFALVILLGFGLGSPSGVDSTFVLNERNARWEIPDLTLPSRATCITLGIVCAFLAGTQLAKGFGRRTMLVVGIVVGVFVFTFLLWAARDDSLNAVGLFRDTVLGASPIAIGAMAGIVCERSGVVNIAIEGMMLTAAFTGAITASWLGSRWLGLVCAAGAGALMGGALAVLAIRYKVNQIIAGTVLNIFALGLTSFLSGQFLSDDPSLNSPGTFPRWDLPLLSDIPILGPLVFTQGLFVYLMIGLVVVLQIGLFRSRWGLRLRAVGEHPKAADTVGIDVVRTRYRSVLLGGAIAGLAGAYFTLGSAGRFDENMTNGLGFIALAAVIFGRWRPVGALMAALLFGFARELASKISIVDSTIPSSFMLMAPYIATLCVVAGVVGSSRAPAAAGVAYEKG
jgi:simple sugar transport system permease protein